MDISVEIGSILGVAVTCLGIMWKIARTMRQEREAEAAKTLKAAKEADNAIKAAFDAKIQSLEAEYRNLKESVEKDFEHVKETHNGALANLGQKVEELREELRTSHSQLVALLSEMIKKQ